MTDLEYDPSMPDMEDSARLLLRAKLEDKGLSWKEASLAIGRGPTFVGEYFRKGVPRELHENDRAKLATLIGVNPDQLRLVVDKNQAKGQRAVQQNGFHMRKLEIPATSHVDKVPIMGIGEGGPHGHSLWNGEVVGHVDRPPVLTDVPKGYAIYVVGSSMEPRYYPGETVYVNPGRPAKSGDFVIVQLHPLADGEPPRALIKRLAKQTPTKLVLEQFNPPKTFDVERAEVYAVHRIVGTSELT